MKSLLANFADAVKYEPSATLFIIITCIAITVIVGSVLIGMFVYPRVRERAMRLMRLPSQEGELFGVSMPAWFMIMLLAFASYTHQTMTDIEIARLKAKLPAEVTAVSKPQTLYEVVQHYVSGGEPAPSGRVVPVDE